MINTNKAQVTVTGTTNLDFEMSPNSFVLQILAVDSTEDLALQRLTVIITDVNEPPVFLDEEPVLYVLEKSPPGQIYRPTVSDPENQPVTFTLTPSNTEFRIDVGSGFLTTTKQFNYLTDPRSYAFNLTVSDGNNSVSRTLVINIINRNDDKPQFLNTITDFTVSEELSPGFIVTNITAVVPDDSLYIIYSIGTNNYLAIHRYTGLVTIANRMDRDSAPLREDPVITVLVTATPSPSAPPSNTITLTITVTDINDNPPICSPDAQRVAVSETEKPGALITTVTCTDNDVETAFREFLFTGLSCLGCANRFALEPTGSNQIVLKGNLDLEDPSNLLEANEYSLLAVAEDKDESNLKGSAYIYVTVTPVNEFPPVFSPPSYFYRISELLGRGTVIGSVKATDRDLPAYGVRYSLISGGGTGGPLIATTTVTINITEANDEPPLCGPNQTQLIVPKDLRTGSNIQGFIMTCSDRDSPSASFIYSISGTAGLYKRYHKLDISPKCFPIGASNLNNHFVFSPSSGTNVTRLFLKEPFDYESGLDRVWYYWSDMLTTIGALISLNRTTRLQILYNALCLTVLVSDGNLRSAGSVPRGLTQTGTVIINILVVDPDLTTVTTTTIISSQHRLAPPQLTFPLQPRVTYITVTENTYSIDDWYIWFVIALGTVLLLGLLSYLLYHLCGKLYKALKHSDCSCCETRPREDQEVLIPEPTPPKREILMEVIKITTVFDGEEVDPVTGRVYEYNSKSGARRWKDVTTVSESVPMIQPESSSMVIPHGQHGHSAQSQARSWRASTGQSKMRSEGVGRATEDRGSPWSSQSRQTSGQSARSARFALSEGGVKLDMVPMTTRGRPNMSEV
ncbi:cadherin-related family member 3 [Oncorhynchus tshawytscha]|uniref:cadherin-related family member 3 n=1 Tax=Oncorhynchus tshawytscha TaxID=74940 RepID=UPI001C3C8406|nr:cadherin-related family member 3 [Oncorhynchus tshawytscha]